MTRTMPSENGQKTLADFGARMPPFSLETEKATLSAIMQSDSAAIDVSLILRSTDFYLAPHQMIFSSVMDLVEKQKGVTPLSVGEHLEKKKLLEEVGGAAYLYDIAISEPHAANCVYHAEIVREKSCLRRVIEASMRAINTAYDLSLEPAEIIGKVGDEMDSLLEMISSSSDGECSVKNVLLDALARIGAAQREGVPSGFSSLDQITCGFQPGHLILLGARPSTGKTAFACNVALTAAKRGWPVLFVSLEQSRNELAERLLAIESHLDSHLLRTGGLSKEDRDSILRCASTLSDLEIWVDAERGNTITDICGRIRLMVRRNRVKLAIVDYLQLIEPADRRVNREQQVATISRKLFCLAGQLQIPILVLVQLNRKVEETKDGRPQLWHLRESGCLEQDANLVLLLHRPDLNAAKTDLIVAKNRDGKRADIPLEFHPACLEFVEHDPWGEERSHNEFEDNPFKASGE